MYQIQNNLNGGIISPWLNSRSDLGTYRNSLKHCDNFVCTPYGGLRRRMGTDLVALAGGRCRLLGYQRGNLEGYILELGDEYVRIHQNGQRVEGVELGSPWKGDEIFEVQYVTINNVLFFSHRNHPPQQLIFNSRNSWSLTPMNFDYPAFRDNRLDGSTISVVPDNVVTSTFTTGLNHRTTSTETSSRSIIVNGTWTVTISRLIFTPGTETTSAPTSFMRLQYSDDNGATWGDIESFTETGVFTGSIGQGRIRLVGLEVDVLSAAVSTNNVPALSRGDSVVARSSLNVFTNDHVGSEIEVSHIPTVTEIRRNLTNSGVSEWITVQSRWILTTSGNWHGQITIEQSTDNGRTAQPVIIRSGAADRNISTDGDVSETTLMRIRFRRAGDAENDPHATLETDGEEVRGRVLITRVDNPKRAVGTVVAGVYSSTHTELWREASWSDRNGYPAAIAWHEGRLWFAGTRSESSTIWASKSDDFFNFESGTDDDDSFNRTIGTVEVSDIVWLASQSSLFIGTSGEEWRGTSDSDSGVITPSSMLLRRISSSGSDPISPIFAGSHLIHIQRQGRNLVQLGYNASSSTEDGYAPTNLNQLAPRITIGDVITLSYQSARDPIIWATTGLGQLIGLTFDRQQNVQGWHQHDTNGKFISVAKVYEGGTEDAVYVSVERNGSHYVERFEIDPYDTIEDGRHGLYTDSSVSHSGGLEITGLNHLEGMMVQIVGGGKDKGSHVVFGGKVTLQEEIEAGKVGLGYTSLMETLPFTFELQDGSSSGRYKRPNYVMIRSFKSVTCEVSCNSDGAYRWEPMRQEWRRFNDLGLEEQPGEIGDLEDWKIPLSSGYDTDARIAIRHDRPTPLNILSVSTNITTT